LLVVLLFFNSSLLAFFTVKTPNEAISSGVCPYALILLFFDGFLTLLYWCGIFALTC